MKRVGRSGAFSHISNPSVCPVAIPAAGFSRLRISYRRLKAAVHLHPAAEVSVYRAERLCRQASRNTHSPIGSIRRSYSQFSRKRGCRRSCWTWRLPKAL
jgi:hypothetical protein